ncbi:MAG TPA: nitroreductase [Clostridia bacterium]|nr:nitroreductase [Clostridia bacterium]
MNETLKTIHELRTIHGHFSDRDVSENDLGQILDACVRAANASARQSYSIITVRDSKTVREQFQYDGSKALLFCVDYNRIIASAEHLGHTYKLDGITDFITGSIDTILAAQTAAIAAKSIGMDSLFTNSIHRRDLSDVYEAFNLPRKYCFPLITLILGYPVEEPGYSKGRLGGKGIIHNGRYETMAKEDLGRLVEKYDEKESHLGLIDNWPDMGHRHYLDWFFTKWSAGGNKAKQQEIISVLKEAGFIDMAAD